MPPHKEKLLPFAQDLQAGAKKFKKSTRTIRRWLQYHGIYEPKEKFRPGKIDKKKAAEIRRLERLENLTQEELGEIFGISQAMVGRIVNNVAHVIRLELGGEAAVKLTSSALS